MIRSAQVVNDPQHSPRIPLAVATGYRQDPMTVENMTVCVVVYDCLDETRPGWVSRAERMYAEDGVLFI